MDNKPATCNEYCNERYGVLDIPWRVYCKKACSGDGETWDDCREDCHSMCHKNPVLKEYEWSAHLDRSPGSPTKSRKCEKACIRGCAYKFNVTVAELVSALPKKPIPHSQPPPPPPPAEVPNPPGPSVTTDTEEPPSISA